MAPYFGLTPETLLDAIESCGVHCDGRLQGLNSYENRVYQAWLDDGSSVVAKFYRPQRWSAEAIQEVAGPVHCAYPCRRRHAPF